SAGRERARARHRASRRARPRGACARPQPPRGRSGVFDPAARGQARVVGVSCRLPALDRSSNHRVSRMASERVLLIEDDASIVAGLELNLALEGYEVVTASDGRTGLRLAQDKKPDVILLDLMLPGVNGLEVLRQLRQRDAEMPVLILTALGEEHDRV